MHVIKCTDATRANNEVYIHNRNDWRIYSLARNDYMPNCGPQCRCSASRRFNCRIKRAVHRL